MSDPPGKVELRFYTEKEKAQLATEARLDEFLKGYDHNELYVLWVMVGRAYQAEIRKREGSP